MRSCGNIPQEMKELKNEKMKVSLAQVILKSSTGSEKNVQNGTIKNEKMKAFAGTDRHKQQL